MRKMLLVLLAVVLAGFAGHASAASNLGSSAIPVYTGHDITPDAGGPRMLYAPSESDDAAYRAAMAAAVGGSCDYYDARFGTPSIDLLFTYDCVMTWANYAYFDNVGFGDNLAEFVDAGGHVTLGAFAAYTSGNSLSGRIMTDTSRYCPVTGGFNHFSLSFWDGSGPGCCVHVGVTSYGSTYRDFLTLVGPGAVTCGRYQDGEIANAFNSVGDVVYANGAGGYPLFPSGQDATRAGNACLCPYWGETPTEPTTWSAVKALYR